MEWLTQLNPLEIFTAVTSGIAAIVLCRREMRDWLRNRRQKPVIELSGGYDFLQDDKLILNFRVYNYAQAPVRIESLTVKTPRKMTLSHGARGAPPGMAITPADSAKYLPLDCLIQPTGFTAAAFDEGTHEKRTDLAEFTVVGHLRKTLRSRSPIRARIMISCAWTDRSSNKFIIVATATVTAKNKIESA